MYFIELINKLKNKKKLTQINNSKIDFEKEEIDEALTCNHVFMPIDSTKKILACSKCGYVIQNKNTKNSEITNNPFLNN